MSRDEIAVMDGGKYIMQMRSVRPFFSDKYDITRVEGEVAFEINEALFEEGNVGQSECSCTTDGECKVRLLI